MKKQTQLAALLLAAGLCVMAQEPTSRVYRVNGEWIEEITGTLAAGRTIRVRTTAGPIRLTGAQQQDRITYKVLKHVHAGSAEAARREFSTLRFTATNLGSVALFHSECGQRGYVGFDLNVPEQTSFVKLETSGGTIQLNEIGGNAFASSGGGDIEVGRVGGDLHVETGGGNIHIVSAGGRVIASSRGGALVIGSAKAMNLQTGAGPIHVNKCTGLVKASTGGGKVDLSDVEGPAQVDSGGGPIHVGLVHGGLHVATDNGPIVVDLVKDAGTFTESRLETSEGNIVVYIPDDLRLTINAAVEMARGIGIRSDFPTVKIMGSQSWWPREVFAEGSLNGGGPVLHVHTTNGIIELKRKNKK